MGDKSADITIDARPYEGHDDCLSAAAADMIARHPRLRGWDLAPRWADDDRKSIVLTVPVRPLWKEEQQMIGIRWIHGGGYANQADEARAIKAAEASLAKDRVRDHVAAQAAFDAAMERGEYTAGNALAVAWANATDAANIAATENWQYPKVGAVELFAWERST